jgi:hypothetical protein
MRRYAVRFLVAVLTFGIGVALSLAFGLFKFQNTKFEVREWKRSKACPKGFVARPAFVTVDSQPADPVKLVYLGTISDRSRWEGNQIRLSIENRSDKTVSQYLLNGRKIWQTSEKAGNSFQDHSFIGVLNAGESRLMTLPHGSEGMSYSLVMVRFEDGSTWTNSRVSQ